MVHNVIFTRIAAEVWLKNSWIFGNKAVNVVCCDGKMMALEILLEKVFLELSVV